MAFSQIAAAPPHPTDQALAGVDDLPPPSAMARPSSSTSGALAGSVDHAFVHHLERAEHRDCGRYDRLLMTGAAAGNPVTWQIAAGRSTAKFSRPSQTVRTMLSVK